MFETSVSVAYSESNTWAKNAESSSAHAGNRVVAVGALVCPKSAIQSVRQALHRRKWLKQQGQTVTAFSPGHDWYLASRQRRLLQRIRSLEQKSESVGSALPSSSARASIAVPLTQQGEALMAVHVAPQAAVALERMCQLSRKRSRELVHELDSVEDLLATGVAEWVSGIRVRSHECTPTPIPQDAGGADAGVGCRFRFCELFAGIGGFRVGLESVGGRCVFASELDREACATYILNFGHLPSGDITEIEAADVPAHDVLCAGFPCQAFSRAGDQAGFESSIGCLFFEIIRISKAAQPKVLFLENVANLLKVEDGRAMQTVLAELRSAGYTPHHALINSRTILPQQRERLYFVAFRADLVEEAAAFCWPALPALDRHVREVLEPARDVPPEYVLSDHQFKKISESKFRCNEYPSHRLARVDGGARTLMASYKHSYHLYSEFVPAMDDAGEVLATGRPRFFTPRECARLMGFPENFVIGRSANKNHAYHQLGNAVCPPVIAAIMESICVALKLTDKRSQGNAPSSPSHVVDGSDSELCSGMVDLLHLATPAPSVLKQKFACCKPSRVMTA
ncbi:hypothetical protein CYMTET_19134 [Cymbomonas tetramitiformis]|uniref:Cytosine-specific methyltransferase n=1 Tax=Cymbomonas tetramitiformis TaxID=36881 RepID=A0AAE0L5A1_9CHLO|nr:hypothetical protein CYMTET_19134 [Cymbomonas tetramitiformis]